MPLRDKERLQYITFDSIKRNFHKVFRKPNDAMAEMLFRYMSDCRTDLESARVNYEEFLRKFDVLWPKKQEPQGRKDASTVAREKKFAEERLAFNILDIDGDDEISILDLVWICSNFNEDNELGQSVLTLFELYMDKNVRPKYVQDKFYLTFQAYMAELPGLGLIADLDYAFHERLLEIQKEKKQRE